MSSRKKQSEVESVESSGHLSKSLPVSKRNFSVEDARAMPGAIMKFLARGKAIAVNINSRTDDFWDWAVYPWSLLENSFLPNLLLHQAVNEVKLKSCHYN